MDMIPAAHAATEETGDLIRSVGLYVEECDRIATVDHISESLAYGADHLNRSARWFLDGRRADHHAPPSTRIVRGPVTIEEANVTEAVATSPADARPEPRYETAVLRECVRNLLKLRGETDPDEERVGYIVANLRAAFARSV